VNHFLAVGLEGDSEMANLNDVIGAVNVLNSSLDTAVANMEKTQAAAVAVRTEVVKVASFAVKEMDGVRRHVGNTTEGIRSETVKLQTFVSESLGSVVGAVQEAGQVVNGVTEEMVARWRQGGVTSQEEADKISAAAAIMEANVDAATKAAGQKLAGLVAQVEESASAIFSQLDQGKWNDFLEDRLGSMSDDLALPSSTDFLSPSGGNE
jgi:hypothetical protein